MKNKSEISNECVTCSLKRNTNFQLNFVDYE